MKVNRIMLGAVAVVLMAVIACGSPSPAAFTVTAVNMPAAADVW